MPSFVFWDLDLFGVNCKSDWFLGLGSGGQSSLGASDPVAEACVDSVAEEAGECLNVEAGVTVTEGLAGGLL